VLTNWSLAFFSTCVGELRVRRQPERTVGLTQRFPVRAIGYSCRNPNPPPGEE
jgi:hypothetical protein